jgi:uncharacterized protein Usg
MLSFFGCAATISLGMLCFARGVGSDRAKNQPVSGKGFARMGPVTINPVTIIKDYRLTTAEIVYRLPDHPEILQSYIWQAMDIAPDYPELQKFLSFWRRELEGELHSVRVAANPVARTGRVRHASMSHTLH